MIREKTWKDYFLLLLELNNEAKMNRLINKNILHENDNKTMKYYKLASKIKHCFKCQRYDYISHFSKKDQKCKFCKDKHKLKDYEYKEQLNRKCYVICKEAHTIWSFKCSKRKKNIIKAKDALRQKLKYHAEDSLKDENTEKAMSIQFKKVIRFLKLSNKKRRIINTLSRLKEFINRILNEEDE